MDSDIKAYKEVERERKEGLNLILMIICFGLAFVFFTVFFGKGAYYHLVTDWNCVEQEDIYFKEQDSLWHLKSNDALFDGIICDYRGDSRYVSGKKEGPHSGYYQEDDFKSASKYFFRKNFLFSHIKMWTRNYSNGQPNGIWEDYDLDGNVIQYSNYSNGKLHGESGVFENGEWKITQYRNGNLINGASGEVKSKPKKRTADIIDELDDAVVLIEIYDYKGNYVAHGSGFIIDKKGTVVTNYHVVDQAYEMKVVVDKNGSKRKYDVQKIISGDKSKDLAKIAIKRNRSENFSFLKLSNSYPKKGEDCWAIGTPYEREYMNTVSKGLVSNLQLNTYPKKIQTNAEITHGSSGGALLNSTGEVIGITSGGVNNYDGARASLNFAISIKELNNLNRINKKRIIDPNTIPCEIAFYSDYKYAGNLYIFVNGISLGSFKSYFTYTPTCGQEGTLKKVLYSGYHDYRIYNKETDKSYFGSIFLEPGDCHMRKISIK
jgi:hypothetical protein